MKQLTDLEITRLCAEAMGWRPAGTRPDFDIVKAIPVEQFPGAPHYQYAPLRDDSSAMALLKKFKIRVYEPAEEDHWHTAIPAPVLGVLYPSYEKDLNRAICETVAKMSLKETA